MGALRWAGRGLGVGLGLRLGLGLGGWRGSGSRGRPLTGEVKSHAVPFKAPKRAKSHPPRGGGAGLLASQHPGQPERNPHRNELQLSGVPRKIQCKGQKKKLGQMNFLEPQKNVQPALSCEITTRLVLGVFCRVLGSSSVHIPPTTGFKFNLQHNSTLRPVVLNKPTSKPVPPANSGGGCWAMG